MANYPKELQELLEQYLTDGVITTKEREVLLRKAEAMNVDKDEFDLYIDAEIQKIDQNADAIKRQSQGKLCPFCEASIPMLADKCPECNENITPQATKEIEEIIDKLEDALVSFKSGKDIAKSKATVERFMRKAKMYYGNNPKIQKLVEEVEMESAKAEKVAKANARKNTFVKILTNWRITGAVILVALIGIFMLFQKFMLFHKSDEPKIELINLSDEAKIEILFKEVSELVDDGNLDEASDKLVITTFLPGIRERGTDHIIQYYDPIYLKVIKAYIKHGNYEAAEELAMSYRGKIGSEVYWPDAPTYIYLKSLYEKEGRDFSALKSDCDLSSVDFN